MKRALLLESGRFRAYVTGSEAHIDPSPGSLQIAGPEDARDLAALANAIAAEMKFPDTTPMNSDALRGMLAYQQQQGFMSALGRSIFSVAPHNPFGR
jgi:hypothetical protein